MLRLLFALILLSVPATSVALEKKAPEEVDFGQLLGELNLTPEGTAPGELVVAMWLPPEFWAVNFIQDGGLSEREIEQTMEVFAGTSLLAVAQGAFTPSGVMEYLSRDEIAGSLRVSVYFADDSLKNVALTGDVSPELEEMLAAVGPGFAASVGEMGENLHMFVLNDAQDTGARLADPWERGSLVIDMISVSGDPVLLSLPFPLDALYWPRYCPNDMPAKASWNFCPWSGEPLPD